MSVFPDARHAAIWAGMCPGNRESGGRRKSGRTRKANPYLRRSLCQSAWAASHSKGTYLWALYRRLRVRLGNNKAIFAVAHQILLTAYTMLSRGEDYRELGADYFNRQNKPRTVNRLIDELMKLGYYVTLQPPAESPNDQTPAGAGAAGISPSEHGLTIEGEVLSGTGPAPSSPSVSALPFPQASGKRSRGRPCKCVERGNPCKHQLRPRTEGSTNSFHSDRDT